MPSHELKNGSELIFESKSPVLVVIHCLRRAYCPNPGSLFLTAMAAVDAAMFRASLGISLVVRKSSEV
jgi:hypothetical protein